MTRSSESELALMPRAPFQQRPVSMLPSWLYKKTGFFSCWLRRRASSREDTQGILRQPLISAILTCSTRRLIAASSGSCARTAVRLRPQANAASRTLLRTTFHLRVRVGGEGRALYPKRKYPARLSFEHASGDSTRALPSPSQSGRARRQDADGREVLEMTVIQSARGGWQTESGGNEVLD